MRSALPVVRDAHASRATPTQESTKAAIASARTTVFSITQLQRTIGNRALQRLQLPQGRLLPPQLAASFGTAFGHELTHVRIHMGGEAAATAMHLGARAF